MAIGPIQLLAIGFKHPDFKGQILDEIERLRQSDTVRLIDSLTVYKDAQGEVAALQMGNLDTDQQVELGAMVGPSSASAWAVGKALSQVPSSELKRPLKMASTSSTRKMPGT